MATPTTAHSEAHGGAKLPFPPFQQETFPSQLVWLAISFVLLYVVVAKLGLPRVGAIIDARARHIEGDLAQAERLKLESEAAAAAYEKALAEARNRAQAIANETRDAQAAEAETTRKGLEAELNTKLEAAERQIEATKSAAMANVRGIAVDTAGAIVERLIGVKPAAGAVEQAVEAALKR